MRRVAHHQLRPSKFRGSRVAPSAGILPSQTRIRRPNEVRSMGRREATIPGNTVGRTAACLISQHASDEALYSERMTGIEPALSAWEADVLPLNYIRAHRLMAQPAV